MTNKHILYFLVWKSVIYVEGSGKKVSSSEDFQNFHARSIQAWEVSNSLRWLATVSWNKEQEILLSKISQIRQLQIDIANVTKNHIDITRSHSTRRGLADLLSHMAYVLKVWYGSEYNGNCSNKVNYKTIDIGKFFVS